jgi:ribosomal protein L14
LNSVVVVDREKPTRRKNGAAVSFDRRSDAALDAIEKYNGK